MYPPNEIKELQERIEMKNKYDLLHFAFIALAEAYHETCKIIVGHESEKFQDCNNDTCKEIVKSLERTKI